jgi:hypothetical protein
VRDRSSKLAELVDEFRHVVAGRRPWGDTVAPPLVFVLCNLAFGLRPAVGCAVGAALVVAALRISQRRSPRYALGGLAAVSFASLLAVGLSRAEGYFLPGMVSGTVTAMLCLTSVLVRRPLAAWTSHLARRWPLPWYWHDQVRPAYSEVTLLWFAFYSARVVLQYTLFQRGATVALSATSVVLGWPAIVLLLAGSYVYGLWRLRLLRGPSVEEFQSGAPAPWAGQTRGF